MNLSVILPVYNAADTIATALESLRVQSCDEMEIIVVNDGSMDGTEEWLRKQADIRLIDAPHRGIVPALNEGIATAKGRYIARMDADDICHPERLQKQITFLDAHPEIGLVGSRVGFGGNRETHAGYAEYVDWINGQITPKQIALNRFVESPFAHPSVMFRRELPEQFGAYRDGPFPEDYELWLRWMECGVRMAKVDEELLTWRDPPTRLSRTDERYSTEAFYRTKAEYLARWLQQNNPQHPDVIIWGAGRITRQRAQMLTQHGVHISHYIDLKPRTLPCGTPVISHTDLPAPGKAFILPMVANRGARDQTLQFLLQRGYVLGADFIFAA